MPSNNDSEKTSSHSQGNVQETAQQSWFELDGQEVAGETLKAKKWATERRVVDDASHHGNIHTGTEKIGDLDKGHISTEDQAFGLQSEQIAQPVEDRKTRVVEEIMPQQNEATHSGLTDQAAPESEPILSSAYQNTSNIESVVAGSNDSDPLVFEEHFDDSSGQSGSQSITRDNVDSTIGVQPAVETEAENGAAASTTDPAGVSGGIETVQPAVFSEPVAVNSNPIAVDDAAVIGHQAQFDGNDTSLVADSSIIADNSEPYTVSLDITSEEQDYGYIISNGGQTGAASGFFVTRGVYGKDSSVYQVGVADENQFIVFQGGEVENGQQTNLTFTYDGQNLTVYQNGIDITDSGSISTRAGRDLPMQNLTIGAPSNVPTLYEFKGETDNVQIYDSALNAAEVGQIQTGAIPDEEGLLVHYTFEGESPLADQSGNGHDLDINGNVQISEALDSKLSTDEDTALTIDAEVLLGNDSDADGDTLSITALSPDVVDSEGNVVGTAVQDDDGNIVFTPGDALDSLAEGEREDVTFTYTVEDGHGGTDTATVLIAVTGKNDSIGLVSDNDLAQNTIAENAENGTEVHLTGLAKDVDGDAVTYALVDGEGNEVRDGAFTIDAENGVVTLQDSSKIDYETKSSHTLHIQASSEDGSSNISDFNVEIGDVEVIRTTDLGGNENGTQVTFTLTGDHYDPKNIQDVGAGSPQYHIRINGEILEVGGQSTFSVEANRGHIEDNHVVRDGNDIELVTFKVPEGTAVDSVSIEFINDAYDYTTDRDGDGITTEDRNLVVKELNIGGTVAEDGTIAGGITLQAEDVDVSQYIASNGVDVSGREVMPWRGTMTFYPEGVPPDTPVITTVEVDNTTSPFDIDSLGDQVDGAGQEIIVTGLYAPGSGENLLEDTPELLTINNYREVDDHGYNYMGGHNYFKNNSINTSQLRDGIVTFSDGTKGIIDSASNGIVRDRDGDGNIDYEENAYIYYKSYDGIEESNPTIVKGEAEPNSTVELFDDGVKIGETTTDDSGHWVISVSMDDGGHNLTSQATDDQGVSSEISDNTPILVGEPDLTADSDSGRSQLDDLTNDQTVTLSGTGANSGETITIYDENDQSVGSGLVADDGGWNVTTTKLTDGDHELRATVTDAEGTESTATKSLQVTIDTIAPESPEIIVVNDVGETVYATDDPGDRTGGAGDNVTVTGLYASGNGENLLADKSELITDNDYRVVDDHGYNYMGGHDFFDNNDISISKLRGGVITFSDGTTGIIDSVSNGVERDSNADGVINDNIVDGVSDYKENSYIYYKAYDDIKEEQPVVITGTSEADSTVEVFAGKTSLGVVLTDAEGNWALPTTNLSEGSHDISAIATDAAGNSSTISKVVEHQINTNEAPEISSVDLGAIKEDSGIKFEAADLLENSSDADGDTLSVLDVSVDKEFGSIEYSTDKEGNVETIKFVPNEDFNGEDVPINFVAGDGHVKVEGKASIDVTAVNDAPVITSTETITVTEDSMEGFSGYGEVWEGDVYSIITQAEMLEHLGITDVDSDSFTVSLANASPAWHEGVQANDSVFTTDTLDSGSSKYDETVVQVTQEFLDNYPTIDAEVGDFYFDHVDFDSLAEGETANIQFSVQVSDGESNSDPRDVNIEVTGSNDAPIIEGSVDLGAIKEDTEIKFEASDLLKNTTDVDGDTLSVLDVSVDKEFGSIEYSTDKEGNVETVKFIPNENFNGEDVPINFVATDGQVKVEGKASIDVTAVNDAPVVEDSDDDPTGVEQSVRGEQDKENQLSSVASVGFDAVESDTAAAEVHVTDIDDLSLNVPSLDLPGEEQSNGQVAELQQGESVQQEALLQDEAVAADTSGGSDSPTNDVVTDSLGQGLPAESLSTLFDDKTEEGEDVQSVDVEKSSSDDTSQENPVMVEEAPVSMETATATSNEPPVVAENMVVEEEKASVDLEVEPVTDSLDSFAPNSGGTQETEDDTALTTDDLHINLDDSSEEVVESESDNNLDSFSANEDNENPEESSLDEFSATDSDQSMEVEVSALDELGVSESDLPDQVDDAGLNDVDAIQEDLSAEPDQVEVIGVG